MNNIKKFFKIFLFSITFFLIIQTISSFFSKKKNPLTNERIEIVFLNKLEENDLKKIKNSIDQENYDYIELSHYFQVFKIGFNQKQEIIIQNIDSAEFSKEKQQIRENLYKIFENEKFYFYYKDYSSIKKDNIISNIKDFVTIKVGSNLNYFQKKYLDPKSFLKISICDNFQLKDIENLKDLKICENLDTTDTISLKNYNIVIREKKQNSNKLNSFFVKSSLNKCFFEVFVDDSGDLPIQWPFKLKWDYLLFWGYIWNVLLIFISSLLYYSTYIFSLKEGIFLGNLGLGILITTILIRTLLWPIYTKTSTFSLNMSMAQPEINKIQQKYYLKKDPDSIKKMQLEIFKVYKKHNFSVFDILISFLQMPIFIAMLRTLNRIRVKGGIFSISVQKPFLNFIYLSSDYDVPRYYFLIKFLLSFCVGLSMFFLNKINFQKNFHIKKNDKILTTEQIIKNKAQEKNMKIVNYFMICLMMLTSLQDSCLSLYWIIGNIYTIFQTIINRNIINKKINLLNEN
ncbi:YidC/Oxa1 family membrane protein insertase [Candidatus Phytoplasma oryzae]|nr:membrane protein insertase YidC [Candidatus Phytoplasma oryzae]